MPAIRIIPCLDVKNNRVVKGVNFLNLRDMGDPVEVSAQYDKAGADELCILDISATNENRDHRMTIVEQIASKIFIPLTVGGGIRTIYDVEYALKSGADKVSINTAAIDNPNLIVEASQAFGNQTIVVAVDVKQIAPDNWQVFSHAGTQATGINAVEWCKKVQDLGAGEILLTSMDADGTKQGYNCECLLQISQATHIPLIASGGVGTLQHLVDGCKLGKVDAVLAASIFHSGEYSIAQAKEYMQSHNIEIRM